MLCMTNFDNIFYEIIKDICTAQLLFLGWGISIVLTKWKTEKQNISVAGKQASLKCPVHINKCGLVFIFVAFSLVLDWSWKLTFRDRCYKKANKHFCVFAFHIDCEYKGY